MTIRPEARTFGPFSLSDANGVVIESWKSRLLRKARYKNMIKGDGSLPTSEALPGHDMKLRGKLYGNDSGDADAKLDAFIAAMSAGEEYFQLYSDRRIRAKLVSAFTYDLVPGTNGMVYSWSFTLRSRWPTWESPSLTTSQFTPTGAGPHSLSVGNAGGTATVWPIVKIKNVGTGFTDKFITLTHAGTLFQIQLVGISLNTNQTVHIDMREGRVGDAISTAITPFAIDGQWIPFRAAATNIVELAHNVGAGASWQVDFEFRKQYWNH